MKSQKSVNQTPVLLNKLVTLTNIRDIEVFEFSFLKTLAELLKIEQLSMYKLDNNNQFCKLLIYSTETELSTHKHRMSEAQEVHIVEIEIPEYIKQAREWIISTNKPYTRFQDNIYLSVYPIKGASTIVGYISLELSHELTSTETLVITSLLSISHNFHSLLEENQKDKLTGLLNRTIFEDSINKIQSLLIDIDSRDEYLETEKRKTEIDNNFWLAIMDIDFFKRINDGFGHVFGDEVLVTLSQIMKHSFRSSDLLFRFGGEEFVAIIRVSTKEETQQILERFRCAVENYKFPQIDTVTISIGVTKMDEIHVIPADIVGRADQALYHAKEHGRNQLHFYEDLVDTGIIDEKIEEGTIELF